MRGTGACSVGGSSGSISRSAGRSTDGGLCAAPGFVARENDGWGDVCRELEISAPGCKDWSCLSVAGPRATWFSAGYCRCGDRPLLGAIADGSCLGGNPGRSRRLSEAGVRVAECGTPDSGSIRLDVAPGICAFKGLVSRAGSAACRAREKPKSRASRIAPAPTIGRRSSRL